MAEKEQGQITEEYAKIIKESVESGDFFKESIKWYIFQYIRPTVDRNNMFLFFLIGAFTVYMLYIMIENTFPLVEKFPVVIKEKDASLYNPIIHKLKVDSDKVKYTADEMILNTLITKYIENREGFDFSDADASKVNQKYNQIKNSSSFLEYKNFQQLMEKSNPNSPIKFFGKKVKKLIDIKSIKLIKGVVKGNFIARYFSISIPTQAQVRFSAILESPDEDGKIKRVSKNYLAKISFDYEEIDRDNKKVGEIGFIVKKYELFDVK